MSKIDLRPLGLLKIEKKWPKGILGVILGVGRLNANTGMNKIPALKFHNWLIEPYLNFSEF